MDDEVQAAPLVIVPLSCKQTYLDRYGRRDKGWTDRDERRWPVPFWHIDTGMAALLILQTAVDGGLGALWFGIVPEAVAEFRAAFGVPEDHEPIGAIAVGYPGQEVRRDLSASRRPGPTSSMSGGGDVGSASTGIAVNDIILISLTDGRPDQGSAGRSAR